ncbi:MAG: hypothetical protein Fur0046_30940 [Cyanobacteria bacterium J069]|nr:MAG: PAS domain S-box protein [Cyanobacteria bacterium J069]
MSELPDFIPPSPSHSEAALVPRLGAGSDAKLREQEQFLRSIYEGVGYSVFVCDVRENGDLYVAGWNPVSEQDVGKRSVDVAGKPLEEVFGPEQGGEIARRFRTCVEQATVYVYEECRVFQGQERWFLTTLNPLKNGAGRVYRLVGTALDITDRRMVEAALRESEERFRLVAERTGQLIYDCDFRTGQILWAGAIASMTGYSPEAFQQFGFEGWKERIHPDDLLDVLTRLDRALQLRLPYQVEEYRFQQADGSYIYVQDSGAFVENEAGEVYRMVGTISDITERKRAQFQLQQSETELRRKTQDLQATLVELRRTQSQMIQNEKMSSLGQLVAGVAHEINNPVNFIYGNLTYAHQYIQELLEMIQLYQQHYPQPHASIQERAATVDLDFLMADLPKLLTSMKVGADRIQKIVASLRTFSRMDEAEMKAVNLHDGIDSTLMILQNRLKPRPVPGTKGEACVAIAIEKDYGDLPEIECYAGQLNQVFMNLLSNAVDALEEELERGRAFEPQISIQTQKMADDRIYVAIADNGPGIPPAVQQRLFDPFFTTKPVGKGTGLGLAISYQVVVEKHGGELRCRSTPGQGTVFEIEIPYGSTQN